MTRLEQHPVVHAMVLVGIFLSPFVALGLVSRWFDGLRGEIGDVRVHVTAEAADLDARIAALEAKMDLLIRGLEVRTTSVLGASEASKP